MIAGADRAQHCEGGRPPRSQRLRWLQRRDLDGHEWGQYTVWLRVSQEAALVELWAQRMVQQLRVEG